LSGPDREQAAYAVLIGFLAARRQGHEQEARAFLDHEAKLDATAWPVPIVRFFRGTLSERELMAAASDNDKQTEAHCYIGYQRLLDGDKTVAHEHFTWVRDHGNSSFIEYTMSLAELDKLDRVGSR
jgi:lipoprotein NlpI